MSLRKEAQAKCEISKRKSTRHLDDRIEIEECLCKGTTFKTIGKRIGKMQQRYPGR